MWAGKRGQQGLPDGFPCPVVLSYGSAGCLPLDSSESTPHIPRMFRRSTAATLLLLMLHVMALGDGLLSMDRSGDCDLMPASSEMAGMPGMSDMAGMEMPSTPPTQDESNPAPGKSGCNLPWAPGCTSVVPCGPTATVVAPVHHRSLVLDSAVVRGANVRAPESPARAPELPPPRA